MATISININELEELRKKAFLYDRLQEQNSHQRLEILIEKYRDLEVLASTQTTIIEFFKINFFNCPEQGHYIITLKSIQNIRDPLFREKLLDIVGNK